MSLRWNLTDGPTADRDISARVRANTMSVRINAEEGSVAISTINVDDPDGDLIVGGLTGIYGSETEVPGSVYEQTFYRGNIGEREVSRGDDDSSFRTGAARKWVVNASDQNALLSRRVLLGPDCNRPAETDVARVQYLMGTPEMVFITEDDYVDTSSPVQMDAADYHGQTCLDLLNDCAQASGKNFWVMFRPDVGDTYGLWYDFAGSTAYSSAITISNDLADVDGVTCFAASFDTKLNRDPSRVFSGVYMPFDGGAVYRQRPATALAFHQRDTTSYSPNVKSVSKANARADRYLEDIATEEDVITTSIIVPNAQVQDLKEGHRVSAKFTHLPGYEDWSWMRVLNRTITQVSEEFYQLDVELSTGGAMYTGDAFAALLLSNSSVGELYFFTSGDDVVVPGWFLEPSVGPFDVLQSTDPYTQIQYTGDLPISVRAEISVAFAQVSDVGATMHVNLDRTRDGITTTLFTSTVFYPGGGLGYWSVDIMIDESGIILEPGDILSCSGPNTFWTNFTVNDSYMRIGRGSFLWNSGTFPWSGG